MHSAARHRCMIYQGSPARQLPVLAAILADNLRAGTRCVYINSPQMVADMLPCLEAAGVPVNRELERGSLIVSADRSHLVNGKFDAPSMLDSLTALVRQSEHDGYPRIWVTGDMTWEFGEWQNLSVLLQYERGLEQIFQQFPNLHGLCQYHHDTLPTSAVRDALCTHQSAYINETLFRVNPYYTTSRPTPDIPTDVHDLLTRFRA